MDKDSKRKNESELLNTIYNYIHDTKNQKLEVKPEEFANSTDTLQKVSSSNVEKIKKESNSILIKENQIICDNILMKFFELNDEKFLACMKRINEWGFETCFREFILNYYLYIKKSNKLRQYIILHLDMIVSMLKDTMEYQLIEGIKNFNFEDYKTKQEIEFLKNDLRNRETAMLTLKAKNFKENAPVNQKKKEELSNDEQKDLRLEFLNQLRKENPELEEYL